MSVMSGGPNYQHEEWGKQLPSADVVEVVRCRECKYNVNEPEAGNANCIILYGMTDQNGFCHYGERMGK